MMRWSSQGLSCRAEVVLMMAVVTFLVTAPEEATASHFRGGTISWRPTGNPNEVEFNFKMGWTYGDGPGCTETKIGQLVTDITSPWQCVQGCGSVINVGDVSYYCKAASSVEDWEQGEKSFTYTFPQGGQGPYTVAFRGGAWIALEGGKGSGNWNLETIVDLRYRSDTGQPNSSPITLSKPIYNMQYGCQHTLQIPVIDPDGDDIRCRLATGSECVSVCDALPGMKLDEDTCTVTFTPDAANSYRPGGWYAVAITVEDTPTSPITVGGQTYNPGDVLTSIPAQFLIQTPSSSLPCDWRPIFVNDTPAEGALIVVKAGDTLDLSVYATNLKNPSATVSSIQVLGPPGLTQGPVSGDDQGRNGVFLKRLFWTPTRADAGQHILCAIAEDSTKRSSEPRCFTVKAWDVDPCDSVPCLNGGTCDRVGDVTFNCTCAPGFTGPVCGTGVDHCAPEPCQNNGSCLNDFTGYTCFCQGSWIGLNCGVLPMLGPFNATSDATPDWPYLEQSLQQQEQQQHHQKYSCPRVAYSNCHCVIAHNQHVLREDDDANSVRDALAALVGLPFGLALGVASYLILQHCSRTCTGPPVLFRSVTPTKKPDEKTRTKPPHRWSPRGLWSALLARWRAFRTPAARTGGPPTPPRPDPETRTKPPHRWSPRGLWSALLTHWRAFRARAPASRPGGSPTTPPTPVTAPSAGGEEGKGGGKGVTLVTNIYRATIGDVHVNAQATGSNKNHAATDTYTSAATDWAK